MLHLVSFKLCPYVQRSVITLKEKGIDFDITYIDLDDPPAWFAEKSPLGKVPILETEKGVLFESAVINEYLDEITEGSLMPSDAWDKAQTRAWVEFGGQCLMDFYMAAMAQDLDGYKAHLAGLQDKLGRLEERLVGPYFLGDHFTLADAALAPLLMRLAEFEKVAAGFSMDAYPRLREWTALLESRPAVADSMVPEWRELNTAYMAAKGGPGLVVGA